MIETISIENNIKSWSAVSSDVSVSFSKQNIIYGLNGSGKSSLAKILAKNCQNIENARFFGRDYIRRNVMLKNDDIRGVQSDFSNKNIEIEAKLESKRKEIQEIEVKIADNKEKKTELERLAFDEISTIVKRRKAGNAKINNKPAGKTLNEVISLWETDHKNAKNKFPNEDFSLVTGKVNYGSELRIANSVQEASGKNFNLLDFQQINDILCTDYENVGIPSNEVINWIDSGVHLHATSPEKCIFCGASNISLQNIKVRLNTYKNDKKSKAEATLRNGLDILAEITDSLAIIADSLSEKDSNAIAEYVDSCKRTFQSKINDMTKTDDTIDISLMEQYEKCISNAVDAHNGARETRIKAVEEKINRLADLVKGAIGKEISESEILKNHVNNISAIEKEINAQEQNKKNLENDCRNLLAEKNDINDFKEYLNQVFIDLGLDFELVLSNEDDKSYTLMHRYNQGNKLTLSDISEGEEHLLALIYFYYEMHEKPDERKLLDNLEVVIIDDPISSLDDNNRFYIREIMKDILAHDDVQIFIMTHSWDDFCSLCYGHEKQYNLFEIQKHNSVSSIKNISSSSVLKPYRLLFNEVYHFSKKSPTEISDDEVIHMPNTLRRVLEEYLSFRINIDRATQNNAEDIFKLLTGKDDVSTIKPQKKIKLNSLLSVCNILSHQASSQPKNKNEILNATKCFVDCLENIDKLHINKMVLQE